MTVPHITPHMTQALSALSDTWAMAPEAVSRSTLNALVKRGLAERRSRRGTALSQSGQSSVAREDNQYRVTKKGSLSKLEEPV